MTAKARKPKRSQPAPIRSLRALAAVLDVSSTTMQRLSESRGFPARRSDGTFDVESARGWLQKHEKRRAAQRKSKADRDAEYEAASARYRAAKAALAEIQLAERRKELIPAADVDAMLAERAVSFARALRARGRRLAGHLQGLEYSDRVRVIDEDSEQILAIYNEAPTWLAAAEEAERSAGDGTTAAESIGAASGAKE